MQVSLSSILHINEGFTSSVWRQLRLQQVMSHFQLPQALGALSQTLLFMRQILGGDETLSVAGYTCAFLENSAKTIPLGIQQLQSHPKSTSHP